MTQDDDIDIAELAALADGSLPPGRAADLRRRVAADPELSAALDRQERAGTFCLTWRAHGLRYGLPASARAHVEAGGTAMANVSRRALGELVACLPTVVVELTAAPATRAARLAARGREDAAEMERRLARASLDYPERGLAHRIANEREPQVAAAALVRLVRAG